MISAIEIYNKPDFKYREETFAILAINSWELLLKAKWLKDNNNNIRSLYVYEKTKKKDGSARKIQAIKITGSGNPFTHSIEHLSTKLHESGILNGLARQNIDALREIRDQPNRPACVCRRNHPPRRSNAHHRYWYICHLFTVL